MHPRCPQPQVRAWNQRAIDLTGLRMVDANLKLTSNALFYKKIKAGKSALAATMKSGVLKAKGSVEWRKEKISFTGRLDEIPALLRNQLSKVAITLTTRHGSGSFNGALAATSSPVAKGAVTAKTPSLRALVAWLGTPLLPGGGLGPVKISGGSSQSGIPRPRLPAHDANNSPMGKMSTGQRRDLI